ncbi:MAG: DUF2147 domain-containing protein [Rhodoblastus sp.]
MGYTNGALLRKVLTIKGFVVCALAACTVVAAAAPAAALDPWGLWVRKESGTVFDFYNCAGKLCAKIVSVGKAEEKEVIGTVILRNAVKDEEGVWRGDIFNAEDGKIYKGGVTVEKPDELELEGCLVKYLCKTEVWKRVADQSRALTPAGKIVMPAPSAKPGIGH